ncbi:MAG TPA: tRNA (adenosine(37)-N6)-threonylcarbamoyltransferase complex transferase subunit TsaD, partial [Candidatus Moranbacteria bacterium]|nr:tRNA (adenosine(37)-N6)-threonylcarbamoyltransferase complex transferase subunit TsaD [Candidatus Moranbacteria bacterium]
MIILGIETSCDDTSVAIIKATNENLSVLSNIVSSQT